MINNTRPLVSIVVASYNNAKYLLECLESTVNQTYDNLEIIIADDCSQDTSQEIAQQFAARNPNSTIKLVFNEKNLGAARNLNKIIFDHTNGKYIKVLDSDDYIANNCIEELTNKLEHLGGNYAFAYGKAQLYHFVNNQKILLNLNGKNTEFLGLYNQSENLIPAVSLLFRRDAFIEIGGYNPDIVIGDTYICLYMLSKYKIYFCDQILGYYQVNVKHSLSQKKSKMRSSAIYIAAKFYSLKPDIITEENFFNNIDQQLRIHKVTQLLTLTKQNKMAALKLYLKLFFFLLDKNPRLTISFWKHLITG